MISEYDDFITFYAWKMLHKTLDFTQHIFRWEAREMYDASNITFTFLWNLYETTTALSCM